jgi:ubiquinone/menaquinone biosynthesis C-methylase UbiE
MNKLKNYYNSQEKHHNKQIFDRLFQDKENTFNYWRHKRMYSFLDVFLKNKTKDNWLTIGDGKYGHEAHYISKFNKNVLATDISTKLLKLAKSKKYIKKYKKENSEKLSFKDETFDYVFCKESYHHFPRPMIALYEMIRVAKKAVILIEPNDVIKRGISWKRINSIEEIKNKINKFEESGNYVYSLSRRDIEKLSLGIGLKNIAFAGLDDIYSDKNIDIKRFSFRFLFIKLFLLILDIAYKIGIRDRSILVAVIFKKKPTKLFIKKLIKNNFEIHKLPLNPYLK